MLTLYHVLVCACVDPLPGFVALKLPEQPTVMAASSFFISFINLCEELVPVAKVVQVKGYPLVQYLLQAISGAGNRSYLNYYSDILYCLQCKCITSLAQWLEVCVCVELCMSQPLVGGAMVFAQEWGWGKNC